MESVTCKTHDDFSKIIIEECYQQKWEEMSNGGRFDTWIYYELSYQKGSLTLYGLLLCGQDVRSISLEIPEQYWKFEPESIEKMIWECKRGEVIKRQKKACNALVDQTGTYG